MLAMAPRVLARPCALRLGAFAVAARHSESKTSCRTQPVLDGPLVRIGPRDSGWQCRWPSHPSAGVAEEPERLEVREGTAACLPGVMDDGLSRWRRSRQEAKAQGLLAACPGAASGLQRAFKGWLRLREDAPVSALGGLHEFGAHREMDQASVRGSHAAVRPCRSSATPSQKRQASDGPLVRIDGRRAWRALVIPLRGITSDRRTSLLRSSPPKSLVSP